MSWCRDNFVCACACVHVWCMCVRIYMRVCVHTYVCRVMLKANLTHAQMSFRLHPFILLALLTLLNKRMKNKSSFVFLFVCFVSFLNNLVFSHNMNRFYSFLVFATFHKIPYQDISSITPILLIPKFILGTKTECFLVKELFPGPWLGLP